MSIFDSITPGIGALASGVLGFMSGQDRNSAQIAQAQGQMDFQERMSSTAYQRAVADMKAAGLNPALAYSQGGASSPAGAMANIENPTQQAVQSSMASAQIANIQADTANKGAQKELMEAQAMQARASAWQANDQSDLIKAQASDIINKLENSFWQIETEKNMALKDNLTAQVTKIMAETQNLEEQNKQIQQTVKLLVEQTGTEGARRTLEEMKAKAMQALQQGTSNPFMVDKMIEWVDKGLDALNPLSHFMKAFKHKSPSTINIHK